MDGRKIHIFLDLQQEYDTVPLPTVLQHLSNKGADPSILSLTRSLFYNCTTQVIVNGRMTVPIRKERGLFQGAILSPWLFNIFINPLAKELTSKYGRYYLIDPTTDILTPPPALFFADDIVISPLDSSSTTALAMVTHCHN